MVVLNNTAQPKIAGHLDGCNNGALEGWALNRDRPDEPLHVEALVDGTVVATGIASLHRRDLEAAGIGTGAHAFRLPLPEALCDDAAHEVEVRAAGTDFAMPRPARRMLLRRPVALHGMVDRLSPSVISGWAWDKRSPDRSLEVEILVNGEPLATVRAERFRPDLAAGGIGDGRKGFEHRIPAGLQLRPGSTVACRIKDSRYELPLTRGAAASAATPQAPRQDAPAARAVTLDAQAAIVMAVINEGDIIALNINHHRRLGVRKFVITDLGSMDDTMAILRKEAEAGDIEIMTTTTRNVAEGQYYKRMIDRVRDDGDLSYVFLLDADEFLSPRDGNLAAALQSITADVGSIARNNAISTRPIAARKADISASLLAHTHIVRHGSRPPAHIDDRMKADLPVALMHLDPKVVVRLPLLGDPGPGNHTIQNATQEPVPEDVLKIIHYPLRSVEQFKVKLKEARVVLGLHPDAPADVAWHWRRWLRLEDDGALDAEIDQFFFREDAVRAMTAVGLAAPNPLHPAGGGDAGH